MKREVDLVAEPGERVEVRTTAKYGWEPGEVTVINTRWYLGVDGSQAHVNWYSVRLDRDTRNKVIRWDRIRKPQP